MLEQLKTIKDYWVYTGRDSLEKNSDLIWSDVEEQYRILQERISSREEKDAFMVVLDELIKGTIHSILVMIDGGDDLANKFTIDLVDQETKESLKGRTALHEEFYSYLINVEE
ncbi:histidine kinase [Desulforamulus ruminis]|uniref:histidine kinase n=1 Tax=Desulforamulus ruminis TaxID=1564 RepID=UPI0023543402|nr:histidine kinase [Desulforamulus ruminis]